MTYSILHPIFLRLRQRVSPAFAVLAGLLMIVALVSCGPLYPGQDSRSPEAAQSGPSAVQASLLVRKYKLRHEEDITLPQYRLADDFMRHTAPAALGLSPILSTRHAQTEYMPLVLKSEDSRVPPVQFAGWGFISFVADFASHARIVEGRPAKPAGLADTVIEAVMMSERIDAIGAKVGDHVVLVYGAPGADLEPIEVKIVGRWVPEDPNGAYWFYQPPRFSEGLMVPEKTYFDVILPGWENIGFEYTWFSVFAIEPGDEDSVNIGVSRIQAELDAILGGVKVAVLPPEILTEDEVQSTTQ